MRIQIRTKGLKLSKAQRLFAERRLGLVLGRFGDRVDLALLHLSGRQGDDTGERSHCRLDVSLHPETVRVEDVDADFEIAVSRAAERASRRVARALEKGTGDGP